MNPRSKSAVRSSVYAIVIGGILSMMALIVAISQSGFGKASAIGAILVYLAYWPMLLIGWSHESLFVSFWLLPMNLIGWAASGFVVGLLPKETRSSNQQSDPKFGKQKSRKQGAAVSEPPTYSNGGFHPPHDQLAKSRKPTQDR